MLLQCKCPVEPPAVDGKGGRYAFVPATSRTMACITSATSGEQNHSEVALAHGTHVSIMDVRWRSSVADDTDAAAGLTAMLVRSLVDRSGSGTRLTSVLACGPDNVFVGDGNGVLSLWRRAGEAHVTDETEDDALATKRRRTDPSALSAPQFLVAVAPRPQGNGMFGTTSLCAVVPHDPAAIAVARQYYGDVTIVDTPSGAHTATLRTIHAPTAIASMGPHCFALAEGAVVSLWDTRLSGSNACTSRVTLPSAVAMSVDVPIGGPQYTVVTGGSDRAVTVWDARKWSKAFVQQNAVKFSITSVVASPHSIDGGKHLVTACGIDGEVRCVKVAGGATPQGGAAAKRDDAAAEPHNVLAEKDEKNVHGGTFRTRIHTSVHADSTLHGGAAHLGSTPGALALSSVGTLYAMHHA